MQILYDAAIEWPLAPYNSMSIQVLEAELGNPPYQVILGRAVLPWCPLIYIAWHNGSTLHTHRQYSPFEHTS